jgi:hypothetical protein
VLRVEGKNPKKVPARPRLQTRATWELFCMSDDMLDLLSDLCNISVVSGVVFSDWCEEIVYMIPKESGVDLLENLRT